MTDPVRALANARSIAVVGAGTREGSIGRAPLEYLEVFRVDAEAEQAQRTSLLALRERRSNRDVAKRLDQLERDAAAGLNVVPACTSAILAYATVGEIVDRLRRVHGSWADRLAPAGAP